MKNRYIFTCSLIVTGLLHAYALSSVEIKRNVIAVEPQEKVSSIINLQRVVIKTPEPIMEPIVEPITKEVLPEPPEPVVEEVVVVPPKKIEKKVLKKVVKKKKVPKKKKIVKKKKRSKSKKVAKRPPKTQLSSSKRKAVKNSYLSKVKRTIEQRKSYPKAAKRLKQEGVVTIRFTILRNGKIKNLAVLKKSKYRKLDKAAIKTVRKIISFEPIPRELNERSMVITVPVKYEILS